jgi:hypothetical protein
MAAGGFGDARRRDVIARNRDRDRSSISKDKDGLSLAAAADGQFDRAGSEARRALELDPSMNEARFCLSRALLYAGDIRSALEAVRPLMPRALAGEIAGLPSADGVHRLIEFQAGDATSDPYQRAWRFAWLGSRAEALAALEEGFSRRSLMMPLICTDPAFRAIRDEARFRAIAGRMGLPI